MCPSLYDTARIRFVLLFLLASLFITTNMSLNGHEVCGPDDSWRRSGCRIGGSVRVGGMAHKSRSLRKEKNDLGEKK